MISSLVPALISAFKARCELVPADELNRRHTRERGIPFLDVVSLRVRGNPNRPPQRHPPRALVSDKLAEYLKRHGCVD